MSSDEHATRLTIERDEARAHALRLWHGLKEWCDLAEHQHLSTNGHVLRTQQLLASEPAESASRFGSAEYPAPGIHREGCSLAQGELFAGPTRDQLAALKAAGTPGPGKPNGHEIAREAIDAAKLREHLDLLARLNESERQLRIARSERQSAQKRLAEIERNLNDFLGTQQGIADSIEQIFSMLRDKGAPPSALAKYSTCEDCPHCLPDEGDTNSCALTIKRTAKLPPKGEPVTEKQMSEFYGRGVDRNGPPPDWCPLSSGRPNADTEHLDWLEAQGGFGCFGGRRWALNWGPDQGPKNVREAIAAARKAESES